VSSAFANWLIPSCRTLFHAVSARGETVSSLLSNNYFPGVSRFHDFCGIAAPNFSRRFQLCLAQLELPVLFPKKREIAEQRPISITKVKAWPFHPALKQRETGRNSQCAASAQPTVERSMLSAQRGDSDQSD
jgi:hypothetical protein